MPGKIVVFPSRCEMREAYRATGGDVPGNLRSIWTPMDQVLPSCVGIGTILLLVWIAVRAVEYVL